MFYVLVVAMNQLTYEKTNHFITVKTHGKRSIKDTFNILQYGEHVPDKSSALILTVVDTNEGIL